MNVQTPLAFASLFFPVGDLSPFKMSFSTSILSRKPPQICPEMGLQLMVNINHHSLPEPNCPLSPALRESGGAGTPRSGDLGIHQADVTTSMWRLWKFISLTRGMNTMPAVHILMDVIVFFKVTHVVQDWPVRISLKSSKHWKTHNKVRNIHIKGGKIWSNRRDTKNRNVNKNREKNKWQRCRQREWREWDQYNKTDMRNKSQRWRAYHTGKHLEREMQWKEK